MEEGNTVVIKNIGSGAVLLNYRSLNIRYVTSLGLIYPVNKMRPIVPHLVRLLKVSGNVYHNPGCIQVGEISQSAKCLPHKHEELSLDPQNPNKIWPHVPLTQEGQFRDRRTPRVSWPASLTKLVS